MVTYPGIVDIVHCQMLRLIAIESLACIISIDPFRKLCLSSIIPFSSTSKSNFEVKRDKVSTSDDPRGSCIISNHSKFLIYYTIKRILHNSTVLNSRYKGENENVRQNEETAINDFVDSFLNGACF